MAMVDEERQPQLKDKLKKSARMKRGPSKMRWLVACTNRRSLRTDSQKDIEEIIRSKLATIVEEPELYDQDLNTPTTKRRQNKAKRVKELRSRFKRSRLFLISRFSLRDSYIHFMAGFVAKGCLTTGLPHY